MKMSSANLMKRLLHSHSRERHPFCNLAFLLCSMLLSVSIREGFKCDIFTFWMDVIGCPFWSLPQMYFYRLILFVAAPMSPKRDSSCHCCTLCSCNAAKQSPV